MFDESQASALNLLQLSAEQRTWPGLPLIGPVANDPKADVARPRQELWYPPSNAMGRLNEAADPQMALAARGERPRVLRLRTDLKIAPGS